MDLVVGWSIRIAFVKLSIFHPSSVWQGYGSCVNGVCVCVHGIWFCAIKTSVSCGYACVCSCGCVCVCADVVLRGLFASITSILYTV